MSEILTSFLKLGLIAFGGPVAHLAYFRQEFVLKRQWLDEQQYAELVAICQILPGPASSQVGFCLGWLKGGWKGALLAFSAFTTPSAVVLILFASFNTYVLNNEFTSIFISSLKLLAFIVVAQALSGMARSFCKTPVTIAMAAASAILSALVSSNLTSLSIILISLLFAYFFVNNDQSKGSKDISEHSILASKMNVSRTLSIACLLVFAGMMIALSISSPFYSFFQAGALVFGGGHVVLPLLEQPLVTEELISSSSFLAGYGATQVVPGPIFTFASYLGYLLPAEQGFLANPVLNAIISTVLIFAPGFLLVISIFPFWQTLSSLPRFNGAIKGACASVVGILIATLISPVAVSVLTSLPIFCAAILALGTILYFKLSLLPSLLICIVISLVQFMLL